MIGDLSRVQKIYLVCGRTDMRKSLEGLIIMVSPSIVSYVTMEKIGLAMPYYRQEFLMQQLGFTLPRETMANWIIYVAGNYFYPIYERLHEELLKRDLVHADETTCQVLREEMYTCLFDEMKQLNKNRII